MFDFNSRILIRLFSFFIGMLLFPTMMNAQQYEGEKNKKGQPDGQGVITFNHTDGVEKLEGIFKKGMPIQGKSMRFDQEGRLTMEFEGTFQPIKKGVFTKLADLSAYGNVTFLYYEGGKNYNDLGYYFKSGSYNGKALDNSVINGVKNYTPKGSSPENSKYFDYLYPMYAYDLMKDKGDISYTRLIKNQGVFDVASVVEQKMEHYTMINICGAVSNDLPNGIVYGLACKDNDIQQLCYFKGEFVNGQLNKINTLKQYFQGGKVRDLYINSEAQKITPFFSEEDFDEYLVIDGEHFPNKMRKVSPYMSVGSSTMEKLASILSNPEKRNNKDIIERAKVICAYKLANPRMQDWDIYKVLKNCPEIANAKDVVASWDGSKIVNIKDAYLDYLRTSITDRLYFFHYVYNDWGPLTEDEIFDTEHNYILMNHPENLNKYYNEIFPDGRYAGKDFYKEAWAEAYINNYKRMLAKNDPKLWVDLRDSYSKYNISYFDWLHYPKLSQGIGGFGEDTKLSNLFGNLKKLPRDLNFNQRKLSLLQSIFRTKKYVFQCYKDSNFDSFRSDVFDVLKEGDLNDEAKLYRSLLDAIGAASQIDDNICNYTNRTDLTDHFQRWYACHMVVDYLLDGVMAARTLSSSTPEIRPACKKAEEFIKEKYDMLTKKVFVNDDAWMEEIKKSNRESQANKEAEEKMLLEVENLELPRYKYEDESWQDDYNDELYRKICFEGLTDVSCTKIWRAKNGSYYKTVAGAFYYSKYKTEKDAIIAAYAYLKYGEVRQKGRIK